MKKLALFVPLSIAIAAAPFGACTDGNGEAPERDAKAAADVMTDFPRSERSTAQPPVDADDDRPLGKSAEGWIEVRIGGPSDCAFFAAPSPEKMPPPIAWEPCSAPLLAKWPSCRQVKVEWPRQPQYHGDGVGLMGSAAWVDPTGHVWLAMNRVRDVGRLAIVGEADGVVHQAIAQGNPSCALLDPQLQDGHVIWTAPECGSVPPTPCPWHAGVGGTIDEFPRVLVARPNVNYFRAAAGFFAESTLLRSWIDGSKLGPPPSYLAWGSDQVLVGDQLFYSAGGSDYRRIVHYSLTDGGGDFVSFGLDYAAWAAGLRSDGKDMVWVEAFGRSSTASQSWGVINLMTAPFTTDPAAIQRRRLRSGSTTDLNDAHDQTVGCGYASFYSATGHEQAIVRLSDGQSWGFGVVKDADAGTDAGSYALAFRHVRAITCDEVFLEAYQGQDDKILRVRLDDLGPGSPAD